MAKNAHNETLHYEFFLSIPTFLPPQVHVLSSPSTAEKDEVPQTNTTTRTVTPFVSIIHETYCPFKHLILSH